MDREGSPDDGEGYPSESHPLRPQAVAMLQVPSGRRSRNASISSSVTDLDAPIYVRQDSRRAPEPSNKRGGGEESPSPQQQRQQLRSTEDSRAAADSEGFNGHLAFAIAAAALGSSFQHGYNTGVVNAPQKLIEEWIKATKTSRMAPGEVVSDSVVTMIWSISVSIFCVGGMFGGAITGYVAERFGRKGGLLLNNALVVVSAILQGCAKHAASYEMIILGRLLIGVNSGLNAGLAPMYLAEISPQHLRGAVGTVYQLVITISILVSQVLGLESILGTQERWPVLLAVTVVPALFQLFTLPLCPESPKFLLLNRGQELEAQRALTWLRGSIEVHDEMDEMRNESETMKMVPKVTLKDMFMNASLRIPLFIAMMVMVAQQLSGINAVMFFSTRIFTMAGLDEVRAQYATLGMGTINVLMTVVSLVLVERAGRKTLLLLGFSGMCVVTTFLTICMAFVNKDTLWLSYISILLVILFVVMFAIGPGSIPWFLVSELFNSSARPTATSLAVAINWTANFIVGIAFLPLQEAMGGNVFIIFVILLALFVLFVYYKVPETKNKTMEEISSMFRQISYN